MVCEPRQQMLNDLGEEIDNWKQQGHQLILMMDCNEDVRSSQFHSFLERYSLKECILQKHGNDAPNTYIDGKDPIDGIFTTSAISIETGGYCVLTKELAEYELIIDVSGSMYLSVQCLELFRQTS